jgi:hypothetical protein
MGGLGLIVSPRTLIRRRGERALSACWTQRQAPADRRAALRTSLALGVLTLRAEAGCADGLPSASQALERRLSLIHYVDYIKPFLNLVNPVAWVKVCIYRHLYLILLRTPRFWPRFYFRIFISFSLALDSSAKEVGPSGPTGVGVTERGNWREASRAPLSWRSRQLRAS